MAKIPCNYDEILKDYLELNRNTTAGQYSKVEKILIQEQITLAKRQHLDYEQTIDRLDKILSFLRELKNTVSYPPAPLFRDPSNKISILYTIQIREFQPWQSSYLEHRISITDLTSLIVQYVAKKWLSSPILECVMINALMDYHLEEAAYQIFIPNTATSLARFFSDGKEINYYLSFIIFKIFSIGFFVIYPIKHLINTNSLSDIVTSLCVIGYYVLANICNWIYRVRKKTVFNKLLAIKKYVSKKAWSPTVLLENIKKFNNHEELFPELIPLIAKAVKRDPNILTYYF